MTPVEEVKSRLDIADLVQEYLPLKPAGSGSFRGLCPFHQEKTPSFYVNRPRQSWHCFGCDQGGDVLSFVMQIEGLEFREALEMLAQKVGVMLPAFDPVQASKRQRLQEVNDLATRFYHAVLCESPEAEIARAYVAKRIIDDLTCDVWRLGYAPQGWTALTDAMKAKDVTEQELLDAGLAAKRDQGTGIYDRFRGRLMFPICDVHGKVVGFTGRVLEDGSKEAKYVNTPETLLYKKSAVLFGLDKAKGAIRSKDMVVIVEGNMDVVSSHRVGTQHVVASSGTSLTREQLGLLRRYTRNLSIAFDQDRAGTAATIRGLDLARQMDFSIRIITLPPEAGKDPDDAVRRDPELWNEAINHATEIIEWIYRRAFQEFVPTTPDGKKTIAQAVLPELKRLPDAVERDAWMQRLSLDLGISVAALYEALGGVKTVSTVPVSPSPAKDESKKKIITVRERVWALLELKPELYELAKQHAEGYDLALDPPSEQRPYLAILADHEFPDQSLEILQKDLEMMVQMLRDDLRQHEGERMAEEMRRAERDGDEAKIRSLLEQFQHLQDT